MRGWCCVRDLRRGGLLAQFSKTQRCSCVEEERIASVPSASLHVFYEKAVWASLVINEHVVEEMQNALFANDISRGEPECLFFGLSLPFSSGKMLV